MKFTPAVFLISALSGGAAHVDTCRMIVIYKYKCTEQNRAKQQQLSQMNRSFILRKCCSTACQEIIASVIVINVGITKLRRIAVNGYDLCVGSKS
jgi:hypothetical protein